MSGGRRRATRATETAHEYRDLDTGNWVACLRDGEVLAELTPHLGFLRFPLAAGESWSQWASWKDHV